MTKGYAIKRIRLINFHNFVDETIDINGHLFLLGGNGSGKTTILDAVHFVLTAGKYNMELNSAARMAGQPRNLGRTLQGIFLRYDLEKGQRNLDKTIGYAALEFEKPGSAERFCIGCGALATNFQTAPHIWGFEAPVPLDQLKLTEQKDDKIFPLNQEELKASNCKVYNRDRYVDVIAEKFFDSRASYRETMNLIAAGKSYRELVSRFQDQSQLFRELLPPPDETAYKDIQSSLQDIEKMQAGLEDQKVKVDLLRELELELAEAVKQRERIARVAYIWGDHRRQKAKYESAAAEAAEEQAQQSLAANRASLEQCEHDLNRIESRIEVLKNSDSYKSQLMLSQQEQQLARGQASVHDIERRIARHRNEIKSLETRKGADQTRIDNFWCQLAEQYAACSCLPGQQEILQPDRESQDYAAQHQLLQARLLPLRNDCVNEIARIEHEIKGREKLCADIEKQISSMRAQKEAAPDAAGFAELEKRLRAESIEFVPFFRTIEPAGEMSDALGRVVEEIIGPQRLCAVLVAGTQYKKAQAAVIAEAYAVPVVDCCDNAPPAPSPGGLRRFLNFHGPFAAAAENYAAGILDAYRFVCTDEALLRSQEDNLVSGNGLVREERSLRRVDASNNRFVGTAARESTRREQIAKLQGKADEEQAAIKNLRENLAEARSQQSGLVTAVEALNRISPEIFKNYSESIADSEARIKAVAGLLGEDEARATTLNLEQESLEEKIRVIRQAIESSDYDGVAGELKTLADTKKEREGALGECRRQQGVFEATIESSRQEIARTRQSLAARSAEFEIKQKDLLDLLPDVDEGGLHQYVYLTQRGQQIKPENCEANLRDAEKESAGQLQKIRSLLLHNPIIQRDFRFQFAEDKLQICDGDGEGLTKLARQHQQHYDETSEILAEKNRKLFEDLIFNDIVRRLCREEETLVSTIKQMNAELRELKFGDTTYSFKMQLRDEFKEFRELIHKVSYTDEASREKLRTYFDAHRQSLVREGDSLPEFLDYRKWHDVVLHAASQGSDGVTLTRKRLSMGSGGEQSVPNYILLLSLAKVHLDHTKSRIRIILMDEAFYGIDPQRRDELLSFADRLDLSLIIAHPELDGVTESLRNTTTLLVEKT
ncbi:MAG TPA: hypothetical protein DCG57_00645, partial [Candidatus Riflebacteria bacterium]|nr:hypothetical protein [Candidatus Riflebacteria bacterium]